jgi:hypothetical protein
MWDVVGTIMLVDIEPKTPPVFRYRLHGTINTQILGQDLTGKTVDIDSPVLAQAIQELFESVLAEGLPQSHVVTIANAARTRRYDRIVLPLGGDGRPIETLLVVAANPDSPTGPRRSWTAGT